MKTPNLLLLSAFALPNLILGQVYEETQIRTFLKNTGGWDMTNLGSPLSAEVPSVQGLGVDKFVGVETIVYSDNATEAFNLTRLSGMNTYQQRPCNIRERSGGWGEVFRYAPGSTPNALGIHLVSGDISRTYNPDCPNSFPGNFFAAAFPYMQSIGIGRSFSGMSGNRATVKLDYVCTGNCPSNPVNSIWVKLRDWDMVSFPSKTISLSAYGVPPAQVVDMAASIISDPGTTRHVDDLEHLGNENGAAYPVQRGRGGILWYGYGCVSQECWGEYSNSLRVRLYAGSGTGPYMSTIKSSYKGRVYIPTPDNNLQIGYSNRQVTRGWLKIDYTGTATTGSIPYAMKAKVLPIGPWDMSANLSAAIPLGQGNFNISIDRIAGVNTTIQSDNVGNGWHITNFHRPPSATGTGTSGDHNRLGGGLTFVEDQNVRLTLSKRGNVDPGYYDWAHSQVLDGNGASFNRGWVRLDYLAGSCEEGPAGYKINAVPGTMVGACAGNSQPFTIEGGGRGTLSGAKTDSITYVYKQITSNGSNRTVTVKVESQDAANTHDFGLAGVMFRSSLAANSRNASMVATRSSAGGVYFRRRLTDDGATQVNQATGTNIKSPCWVRVKKVGDVFSAYYHTSTSNTMPASGWIKLGTDQTIPLGSSYYLGLMVSNLTDPRLSKVKFRGLTESNP